MVKTTTIYLRSIDPLRASVALKYGFYMKATLALNGLTVPKRPIHAYVQSDLRIHFLIIIIIITSIIIPTMIFITIITFNFVAIIIIMIIWNFICDALRDIKPFVQF